jgi:uncharacterized protein involved in exopolysaccharide biosynthesis
LQIREAGRDNLYTLAYTDTDAQRAKRVVQSMVSIFVESGLGDKRKDSDTARRFIEEQIKAYEQKLEDAENRLKEYKLRNIARWAVAAGLLPQDDRSHRAAQPGTPGAA